MKTVVITGSSRGLGFEMAKRFRKKGCNVVINGTNSSRLESAKRKLERIPGDGGILAVPGNVAVPDDLEDLASLAEGKFGRIDIWINNAGVNQPQKPMWELSEYDISALMETNLLGAINGSRIAMRHMIRNHSGAIYNMEGYGSNDAMLVGLNMYGTSKRALTHFTTALAKESAELGTGVIVGKLSPGIMITDFMQNALDGREKIELSDKTKAVYNILGDKPEHVAKFFVDKIDKNKKNNVRIQWLTNAKAAWRFMTAKFNKKDYFI